MCGNGGEKKMFGEGPRIMGMENHGDIHKRRRKAPAAPAGGGRGESVT